MMELKVVKAAQELVLEGRKSAKTLAREIGKPYPTLLRELNPYDAGAKLGVETLLRLMKSANDIEPLRVMAEEMGFMLAPAASAAFLEKDVRRGLPAP